MFTRLGAFVVRHRGIALAVSAVLVVFSALVGPAAIDRLAGSGFDDPSSDSVAARAELDRRFDTGFPDLAFLVTVTDAAPGTAAVDRDDVTAAGIGFTAEIASIEGTDDVVSYWSLGRPDSLRSADGTRAMVLLRLPGAADDAGREELTAELLADYGEAVRGPLTVELAGREAVFEQMAARAEADLSTAEMIAIPLTLLLLVLVFRSVVAALVPVLVGVATLVGALAVLAAATAVTDVSIFALNLVTALGLGLAIDYSLLIVNRYREERGAGHPVDVAVERTVRTAGRTVAFSGLTVAVSLSALVIFPIYFLRSFAYAGIGVILFALFMSLVPVPALLSVLGDRIDRLSLGRPGSGRHGISVWREQADKVVARPWRYLIGGVLLLALAAVPFAAVQWGESDYRSLPPDDPVRVTSEALTGEFPAAEANAFPIVAIGGVDDAAITDHALTLSTLPGVQRVDTATGVFAAGAAVVPADEFAVERFRRPDAAWFNVVPSVEPISAEGQDLVTSIRAMDTPFDTTLVGGATAAFLDTKAAVVDNLPLAAGLIFGVTYVLLFLMFGSVLVPLKAIVLNLLSLGATFGLIVVVFQEGLGEGLLGITTTGFTDITTPILVFGIAFGLSMDYEVFLLSRIKEEYDRSGHNRDAIVEGIDRTGPIVTAAALLLTITFLATATSGLSFVKLFGLGLAVAVLVDAFIVRITVVPALMAVADRANWWAPRPLRRLHARWGIAETEGPDRSGTDPGAASGTVIDLRDPERSVIDLREPAERPLFADVVPKRDRSAAGDGSIT